MLQYDIWHHSLRVTSPKSCMAYVNVDNREPCHYPDLCQHITEVLQSCVAVLNHALCRYTELCHHITEACMALLALTMHSVAALNSVDIITLKAYMASVAAGSTTAAGGDDDGGGASYHSVAYVWTVYFPGFVMFGVRTSYTLFLCLLCCRQHCLLSKTAAGA
jgi:hypothetical protein